MKGLLLKDFYMAAKYCRTYLLVAAVFILGSAAGDNSFFFTFYPCIIPGMIPVTLLGYDERSKWNGYCGALPYTKTQIVSGKYLIGLFAQIAVIVLSALVQGVKMYIGKTFEINYFLTLTALLFTLSCVSVSFTLPFMFRFGVEKGRIAYYVMVGLVCSGSVAASDLFKNTAAVDFSAGAPTMLLYLGAAAVYALSWYLSVIFYKKREV